MNRRSLLRLIGLAPVAAPMAGICSSAASTSEVVWVVSIDVSRHGTAVMLSRFEHRRGQR